LTAGGIAKNEIKNDQKIFCALDDRMASGRFLVVFLIYVNRSGSINT